MLLCRPQQQTAHTIEVEARSRTREKNGKIQFSARQRNFNAFESLLNMFIIWFFDSQDTVCLGRARDHTIPHCWTDHVNEIIVGIFNSTTSLCRSASLPIYQKLEVFKVFFFSPSVKLLNIDAYWKLGNGRYTWRVSISWSSCRAQRAIIKSQQIAKNHNFDVKIVISDEVAQARVKLRVDLIKLFVSFACNSMAHANIFRTRFKLPKELSGE